MNEDKNMIFNVEGGQVNISTGQVNIFSDSSDIRDKLLLAETTLPIKIVYDSEYVKNLYEHFDIYYNYILHFFPENLVSLKSTKENIDLIKHGLHSYFNGRVNETYNCIKKIIVKYYNSPYIVAPVNENYAFRGLAPKKIRPKGFSKEYDASYQKMLEHELSFFKARVATEKLGIIDMLHIPFDKRNLVATQRFSIPGIPCIYLATTTYGSWLELGTPEADIFQVSAFKIPSDLRILNLCLQWKFIYGIKKIIDVDKEFFDFLEIYPLIIATSYHVSEMGRRFKSEYIISQIVMQVCNELKIDGIAYLSKRTCDSYAYPQAVNLAIAVPYNTEYLYWSRANEIYITDPVRFSDFAIIENTNQCASHFSSYVNEIYKNNINNDIILAGKKMKYTNTGFSAFDEYLVKQEFSGFTDILKL